MNGLRAACLFASSALATITTAPAFSQSPPPSDSGTQLSDIVVTAQRREESLQDVPVAVTAISAEQLGQMRVTNVSSLSGMAPSLQIQTQGIQSTPIIAIRGISGGTSNNSVDPKVGIYLDGVYVGRTVGSVFDLADIERIEVLRGPQGTLFGRNATSGAISLVTAPPTGEFGVKQDLSYGNYDAFRTRTVLNLPELGPLSIKLSYLHDEIRGDAKNLIGGRTIDFSLREPRFGTLRYADRLGSRNTDAMQASARLDLGDLTIDYHFDHTDSRASGRATQQLGIIPDSSGAIIGKIFEYQAALGGVTNLSNQRLGAVANATSTEHVSVSGHSLTMTWNQSDAVTVKSITAFRKLNQRPNINDLAATGGIRFTGQQLGYLLSLMQNPNATPADYNIIPMMPVGPNDSLFSLLTARSTKQKQFSEELQFQVTQDAFDLVAGAFYFHERSPALDVLGIFQPIANGMVIPTPLDAIFGSGVTETVAVNSSMALYGQATFHLTDQLDFSAGLRYTSDSRLTDLISISGGQGGQLNLGRHKADYTRLNYAAILTWKPNSDITAYGKVSTGYVAGGIMSGIAYDPEMLTSYELGLKSNLWDNRLRANAALYYMDYKDLQTQNFINGVQSFNNAGKANIKGFELEVDAVPTRGLTLSGSVGYADFKFDTFVLNGVDVADVARPPYTAKWTGRVAAQYDLPEFAGGGNPFGRVEGRYRSRIHLTSTPIQNPAVEELNTTPGYWLVDARAGVASMPIAGTKVNLSAFAKNLFDKDVRNWGAPAITLTGIYDWGRTYGVDFSIAF